MPDSTRPRSRLLLPAISAAVSLLLVGTEIGFWLAATGPAPLPEPPAPPALRGPGIVPDFSLTERSDRPVRPADPTGMVWVADFIYTTRTDTCPL